MMEQKSIPKDAQIVTFLAQKVTKYLGEFYWNQKCTQERYSEV